MIDINTTTALSNTSKNKMKHLALFLLFFQIGFSQNNTHFIKGSIFNKKTNESIPFVTITLKSKTQTKSTIADENGQFIIEKLANKSYLLLVEAIGYKSFNKSILFKDQNYIDLKSILLEESVQALDAVVIRAETSTIKQKIDRVVINVGKDLTSVGTDAASVLNNVQSVSVDQQTGELSLRGNSNVRVLIDGKPSNIPTDQLLKQLPSNAIKNIELITNPSAKYNPEGNSGIINIELVKNSIVGFNGSVNANVSHGRNISGSQGFNLNYKKDNINWYVNYNFRAGKNNILGKIERDNNIQNTFGVNQFKNHFVKFGTDIDLSKKTSISLFTVQSFNKLNYVNTTGVNIIPSNITINNSVFNLTRKPRNKTYDASIHHIFDKKKHNLDFGVSFRDNKRPEDSFTLDKIDLSNAQNNFVENIEDTSKNIIINLDYAKPFNDDISLEVGLQYRQLNQTKNNNSNQEIQNSLGETISRGLSDFDFDRNIYSVYFNYRHQINKLGIQIGLRAESYNLDANFFSAAENNNIPVVDEKVSLYPSIFTTYELTDKDQLQASYSRRVDRPSARQLTPIRTWGTPLLTSQGNPNLKQQFTNSVELKYNRKIKGGNISLTGFYRNINDFISRSLSEDDLIENRLILSYANFDTANNYGFELSTYLKFKKWWKFNGSSDVYLTKQQGFVNNKPTTVNNVLFNIRTNNSFTISKKLNLQINQLYRGKNTNLQRVARPMFMIGAASSYKVLDDKGTITLGFSDIFNTFRARFSSENPIRQKGEFNWESQRITLGLVYNFGQKFTLKKKRRPKEEREAGGDVF